MSSSLFKIFAPVALGAAAAVMAVQSPAMAQKTISLTAVDGYPPRALQVKTFIKFFIPEVDKRLAKSGDYKIRWNQAFAGQIVKVKRVMTGMQQGLGDIGVVTTVFHQEQTIQRPPLLLVRLLMHWKRVDLQLAIDFEALGLRLVEGDHAVWTDHRLLDRDTI